jgi:hypothetical protein
LSVSEDGCTGFLGLGKGLEITGTVPL